MKLFDETCDLSAVSVGPVMSPKLLVGMFE